MPINPTPDLPAGTAQEVSFPPLPEPYTVVSTIKCTACGAPYTPSRPSAMNAAGAAWMSQLPPHACGCGNTQFSGTVSSENVSPAQFTASQMHAYVLLDRATRKQSEAATVAPDGFVLVPRELTDSMLNEWDFYAGLCRDRRVIWRTILAATPTQQAASPLLARKPLSDTTILNLTTGLFPRFREDIQERFVLEVARAIEAAHGIIEEPK